MFKIAELQAGGGTLALCPAPGRHGDYAGDLDLLLSWRPALVLSMTEAEELARFGAAGLEEALREADVVWRHLPIRDFDAPGVEVAAAWPGISSEASELLARGGRVLVHCAGGCGRSGMAVLRLMVEQGEPPDVALARLRSVRPCAVETQAQMQWATAQ